MKNVNIYTGPKASDTSLHTDFGISLTPKMYRLINAAAPSPVETFRFKYAADIIAIVDETIAELKNNSDKYKKLAARTGRATIENTIAEYELFRYGLNRSPENYIIVNNFN
jgi:hypothetical protein